jgi:hypothetical protein
MRTAAAGGQSLVRTALRWPQSLAAMLCTSLACGSADDERISLILPAKVWAAPGAYLAHEHVHGRPLEDAIF